MKPFSNIGLGKGFVLFSHIQGYGSSPSKGEHHQQDRLMSIIDAKLNAYVGHYIR
jgi:hypothetical protein